MKVRPISDLHIEFWSDSIVNKVLDELIPPLATDKETVLCIAGDTGLLHRNWTWLTPMRYLSSRFKAIVTVAGNHCFYHNPYFHQLDMWKKEVKLPSNVHLLENEAVGLEDVVFIGASLWTNMDDWSEDTMNMARRAMMDYRCITGWNGSKIEVADTILAFESSKKYIFRMLDMYKDKKTVVITHHLPSYQCVSDRFKGDLLNPAFATELSEEIAMSGADYWIFGHTHDSHASIIGETHMLCNPYGYREHEVNPKFNRSLLIEV